MYFKDDSKILPLPVQIVVRGVDASLRFVDLLSTELLVRQIEKGVRERSLREKKNLENVLKHSKSGEFRERSHTGHPYSFFDMHMQA